MPMIFVGQIDFDRDAEYFCNSCGHLRLFIKGGRNFNGCGNCGSFDVVWGAINSLDKDTLKAAFAEKENHANLIQKIRALQCGLCKRDLPLINGRHHFQPITTGSGLECHARSVEEIRDLIWTARRDKSGD